MSSEVLSVERQAHVATLWLDRPEARNAMGPAFWADLPVLMAELSADPEVRAVVVAARGPHFSVGLDLKQMGAMLSGGDQPGSGARHSRATTAAAARLSIHRMQASISSVADCPKPVVAAVHGYCIGGGVDLISACDIRVASADAVFSVRETKMAIVADLGSLQRLPAIIGAGHLAELAYTGKDISVERAKEIGLVNHVSPDAKAAVDHARSIAEEIASNSPLVVQGTKTVLQTRDRRSIQEGLDYVAIWNSGFLQSDDLVEAVSAFMEKRAPKFTGN
ncbi:MAG: crotonase/enoyl-CoA hydratase family protein [Acidimicrobiales bacterium]